MKYPYPVMYQNVYCYDEMKRAEHMAVRETVGWYLWTHQIVEVTGKDATAVRICLSGLRPIRVIRMYTGKTLQKSGKCTLFRAQNLWI